MDDNATEKQSQMSFHNESRYIDPECFNDDLEEVIKFKYFFLQIKKINKFKFLFFSFRAN